MILLDAPGIPGSGSLSGVTSWPESFHAIGYVSPQKSECSAKTDCGLGSPVEVFILPCGSGQILSLYPLPECEALWDPQLHGGLSAAALCPWGIEGTAGVPPWKSQRGLWASANTSPSLSSCSAAHRRPALHLGSCPCPPGAALCSLQPPSCALKCMWLPFTRF